MSENKKPQKKNSKIIDGGYNQIQKQSHNQSEIKKIIYNENNKNVQIIEENEFGKQKYENEDPKNLLCKVIRKHFKNLGQDFYEYVTDLQAYNSLFIEHKQSKFAKKNLKQNPKNKSQEQDICLNQYVKDDILLSNGQKVKIIFYPILVSGRMINNPQIPIKSTQAELKATSKMVFLQREQIQEGIIRNLSYDPIKQELQLDNSKLIEFIRDLDVNYTRRIFTQTYGKILIAENYQKQEQQEIIDSKIKFQQLDIQIQMPRAEIQIIDNNCSKTFIIYFSASQLQLLVKDKFLNWSELIADFFEKDFLQQKYIESNEKPHTYYMFMHDKIETFNTVERYLDHINKNSNCSLSTKMMINCNNHVFLHFEGYRFDLRWEQDEPVLCSCQCFLHDPQNQMKQLANLDIKKIDILKGFAEESIICYYDPTSQWRMVCDFDLVLEEAMRIDDDRLLKYSNLDVQRSHLQVLNKKQGLHLGMFVPTIKIIKHEKLCQSDFEEIKQKIDIFENITYIEEEVIKIGGEQLLRFVEKNFEKWELIAFDLIDYDYSNFKL